MKTCIKYSKRQCVTNFDQLPETIPSLNGDGFHLVAETCRLRRVDNGYQILRLPLLGLPNVIIRGPLLLKM